MTEPQRSQPAWLTSSLTQNDLISNKTVDSSNFNRKLHHQYLLINVAQQLSFANIMAVNNSCWEWQLWGGPHRHYVIVPACNATSRRSTRGKNLKNASIHWTGQARWWLRLPHWAHICDTGADCWYCDDVTQILETCDKMIHGCDTLCDSTRPHWSETKQYLRHRKYFTGIFGHHKDNARRC